MHVYIYIYIYIYIYHTTSHTHTHTHTQKHLFVEHGIGLRRDVSMSPFAVPYHHVVTSDGFDLKIRPGIWAQISLQDKAKYVGYYVSAFILRNSEGRKTSTCEIATPPVNAPLSSMKTSSAPTLTFEPLHTSATGARKTYGQQTMTSMSRFDLAAEATTWFRKKMSKKY